MTLLIALWDWIKRHIAVSGAFASTEELLIHTHYDPPPIPDRRFDWTAILADDNFEATLVGYGKTENEAREDLLAKIEERSDR